MWFGDLVTMRWWDDLWLNESFATWASVVAQVSATEYTSSWTTFANVEKSWAYVQDQLPSTHPIAADMVDLAAVEVNFDGITYAKGASVLKQLAAYVGFEEFLTGLRAYFAAHAFGNATLEDLLVALERTSGRDLHGLGGGLAADHRPEHHQRGPGRRRLRSDHPLRGGAVRRGAGCRGAPPAPAGDRGVRPGRRRPADPDPPGGTRRRRRAHRGAGAGRCRSGRAGAAQRRRPDLLQGTARSDLAVDRHRRHRADDRIAAENPAVVGGLGDDPGRPDAGTGFRHARGPRHGDRGPDRRPAAGAGPAPGRRRLLRRPGVGGADRLGRSLFRAARAGGRRSGRQRHPAGRRAGVRRRQARCRPADGDRRLAGRLGSAAGTDGRHRPVLDPAGCAGRARGRRLRGDRRGRRRPTRRPPGCAAPPWCAR